MSDRDEVGYFHKHIAIIVKGATGYATKLPGGVWQAIAPDKVAYPFLTVSMVEGMDTLTFGGYAGAGITFLLKIMDKGNSEVRAQETLVWLQNLLEENDGSPVSGAYVWVDRQRPYNLPVIEDDQRYQQVGRFYRVFVDPIGA